MVQAQAAMLVQMVLVGQRLVLGLLPLVVIMVVIVVVVIMICAKR